MLEFRWVDTGFRSSLKALDAPFEDLVRACQQSRLDRCTNDLGFGIGIDIKLVQPDR